ncbi:helicase loader [Gordonia phage Thimann]|nr:helicase loader [Gordonia phage Thimann]
MTTHADALEVMLVVQACHPRTAPRQDDPEVTDAMAIVWAEMFDAFGLELDDLRAAVKRRAVKEPGCPAPEPGEIVKYAREIRNERAAKEQADPELRAGHEARIDAKVERMISPLAAKLGRLDRPALRAIHAPTRETPGDPDARAQARAELDALRSQARDDDGGAA